MLNIELDHIVTHENAAARIEEIFTEVQATGRAYVVTINGAPAVTISPVEASAAAPAQVTAPMAAVPEIPTPTPVNEPEITPAAPAVNIPETGALPPIVDVQPLVSLDNSQPFITETDPAATPEENELIASTAPTGPLSAAPETGALTDAPPMDIPTPAAPATATPTFNDLPDMPDDPTNGSPLA